MRGNAHLTQIERQVGEGGQRWRRSRPRVGYVQVLQAGQGGQLLHVLILQQGAVGVQGRQAGEMPQHGAVAVLQLDAPQHQLAQPRQAAHRRQAHHGICRIGTQESSLRASGQRPPAGLLTLILHVTY